jgi:hypothetical protein
VTAGLASEAGHLPKLFTTATEIWWKSLLPLASRSFVTEDQ